EPPRVARRDRRGKRDHEATWSRLNDPIRTEEGSFNLLIEADDDARELARPRHFARRAKQRDAEGSGVAARRLERVVAGDAVAPGEKVARHRRAHLSEAENSDFAY